LGAHKGVTLLELLVTIGVVAIVTALTIPVLRSVGLKRHDVKNLTSLRSTHQQFREYANDHDDYFVNCGAPRRPGYPAIVDFGDPNGFEHISYLGQQAWWPMVLATYTREGSPTWHSTHWPPPEIGPPHIRQGYTNTRFITESGFLYSPACITAPSLWRDDAAPNSEVAGHFRRVRWNETSHASSKGMLFDSVRPQATHDQDNRTVVFVDGSAGLRDFLRPTSAPPGAARRGMPVLWTPHGILGRDF
jgi:prepilin-type N-terminal cleavage/methylation domain-containing protein